MPNIEYGTGGATTTMCFNQLKYGEYEEAEQSVTLRANGGDCGGGSEVLVVQNINVECILNLDTTIKIGDRRVCFTLGGTRNIPVVVVDDEPICIESAQANAGIMRGGGYNTERKS